MTAPSKTARIAFVGFGEAGIAFVSGWGGQNAARIGAFDIKPGLATRYAQHSVTGHDSPRSATQDAQAVFRVVTADQAQIAAQSAADTQPFKRALV